MHEQVTALTMKVARPLVWHDARQSWPKRLLGGSCFILRFDAGLIGVTAEHVIKAFEKTQIEGTSTVCLLRTVLFDLTGRIIDRDPDLDIATFAVTENELVKSEAIEVDCRSAWPPPVPDIGRELSLAGFPEEFKKDYSLSPVRIPCVRFAVTRRRHHRPRYYCNLRTFTGFPRSCSSGISRPRC